MSSRIVSSPAILDGKPCLKGTRISVDMILEWLMSGANKHDIAKSYPQSTEKDVEEALKFAAHAL